MISKLICFVLCLLISYHVGNSSILATYCDDTAAYNTTSPGGMLYMQNMASLFAVLYSNASQPSGFYNYTAGGGGRGQEVNGLFLCRGDLTAAECQVCLKSAIIEIFGSCSNVTRATTWYDECLLRYSNLPIFSKMETKGGYLAWDGGNVTDGAQLNRTLAELFPKLAVQAAYGTDFPGKKFAVGDTNFTAFGKIFALAQCTPDLTNSECWGCLVDAISYLPRCCTNRVGGHVLNPSCVISYSTAPFYQAQAPPPPLPPPLPPPPPPPTPMLSPPPPEDPTPPPPPPPAVPDGGGTSTSRATIAAMVSPATAFVAFVVALFIGQV